MMRTFALLLIVPLTLAILVIQCEKEPETNPPIYIPDQSFLDALIKQGVDTNGDSLISETEAEAITQLNVSNCDISDMTGIELFRLLRTLDCSYNQIASLDVSKCYSLGDLNCAYNQLTGLDLSKNVDLKKLVCTGNQLAALDLTNNPKLVDIYCNHNKIASLELYSNDPIKNLDCSDNQLTSLEIVNRSEIFELRCYDNQP